MDQNRKYQESGIGGMATKYKIKINSSRTIGDVQKDFHALFPFLNIHFFDARYRGGKLNATGRQYAPSVELSRMRMKGEDGELVFKPTDTVASFEQRMWDDFGLCVQVFRSSGISWIQTSLTDSWTLEQQNNEGRELSHPPTKDQPDLTDRDVWE